MMVSVLHKELECRVEKLKYNRKQIRNSSWWINRPISVHTKFYSFTVYHLLVNNNKETAGELKREGGLIEDKRYIKKITYSWNMQLVCQKRHRFAWTWASWNRWVRMTFQPRFSTKPRPWVMTTLNQKCLKGVWVFWGRKNKIFVYGDLEGIAPEKSHRTTIKWRCKLKRNIILYTGGIIFFTCNEATLLYRNEAVLYFIPLKNKHLENGKNASEKND